MGQRFRVAAAAAVAGAVLGALAAAAALAGENIIVQSGRAFEPAALTVKAGDGLTFVNRDLYDHNVYSASSGNGFNIGIQVPGDTSGVTLSNPGTVEVRCRIHPKMRLVVTVE